MSYVTSINHDSKIENEKRCHPAPDSKYADPLSKLKELKLANVNKLLIAQLNINGLASKFDDLKHLIAGNKGILLIIESKLDNSYPPGQFNINGFSNPFRQDRNEYGGGIMIYVREDVACKELKSPDTVKNIEAVSI